METWNRLTETRGEEEGDSGGKKGKDESKNKYEWTAVDMDMAYSVGIDGGSRGWAGQRRRKEGKLGQL